MLPATAVPPHPLNTLDRIAFYKSVREKRKQLQLNHLTNGKDNESSSTENAFLTQMLQASSNSAASTSISSSLSIPSLLRKGDFSPITSSHRTASSSTLTNILPALLNGTLQSPRALSPPSSGATANAANLNSPTSTNTTDTLVDIKASTSLPVSPIASIHNNNNPSESSNDHTVVTATCSPPRCRSYPMTVLTKRTSPSTSSNVQSTPAASIVQSVATSTSYLLATASSCPSLTNPIVSSVSPSPDDTTPKIVRSASVKSCASDSGVSSSSPLSDNNIVHVFRTNHIETNNQQQMSNGSRKRKSLAHFYDELNKDKKFSTEATVSSGFAMPTSTTTTTATNNIPLSQQEAIAIGYAQYALMHSLTQQFRVNYPAAFLHAAAASGYLQLPTPMMAAAVAAAASTSTNNNPNNSSSPEKFRERRKQQQQPESDNNNNHMRSAPSINDQPYRRETYQTLLESSRLLGQHKLLKPVPIDLRKHNGGSRTIDNSPIPSNIRYPSSSSSTSPSGSPSCVSPSKSNNMESVNEYVCIPKKLMPVIGARINDWLERNVNFALSLPVIQETIDNDRDKFALLSRIWHRLLIISMIENSFEIYVTKDLQIPSDVSSTTSSHLPTENDVKQIELLITRGKTLEIDEIGFNLIREVIIYKEGKTLFENSSADSFEKAECHAQSRLTTWCSSRVKYSKIVFFLCNIYQVKEDIFERLFCAGSMHQSTPIHTYLERLLASASSSSSSSMDDA
ncbi:unnamed protein product [Rotaria magnacalcarata]|uniref:NR LBD domain-containing protein n=5 Tax=Rotaria magnacalcarata TaxID=392030 RepID=A0A816MTL2_9BILA|nr:unnamed protein product [Rotaria magnacalcarata]CAF2077765.1 unnamed protein product [Rotaria magnacalcarata]CAF3915047.1 unnamed protein product [Rotaria magnacalcarata]CAF4006346.1 unnamed protein product [Rotaria magnacalcarata]